jgi:hypothetical protein
MPVATLNLTAPSLQTINGRILFRTIAFFRLILAF